MQWTTAPRPCTIRPQMKTPCAFLLLVALPALAADQPAPPKEEPVILTPAPPAEPRINGAKVFGVRPSHPILYTIAATGERPMTFSAEETDNDDDPQPRDLPEGLHLDATTGRLTGTLSKSG